MTAFEQFLAYKTRVPVRGAILLNHELDSVVLVRGWRKGASWSFPRGKINKDEPDIDCAIREVWEETGFDVRKAGLVTKDEDASFIEMSIRDQHLRLYIFRDVPMETHFEPRTRKEIGKIEWYKLSELPTQKKGKNRQQDGPPADLANHANRFYMVAPFIGGLKKWIAKQKKLSKQMETPKQILTHAPNVEHVVEIVETVKTLQPRSKVANSQSPSDMKDKPVLNGHQPGEDTPSLKLPEPTPLTTTSAPYMYQNVVGTEHQRDPPILDLEAKLAADKARGERAQSLLALLKGKTSVNAAELPQTPAEQVISQPQMPPSPKHHQAKPEQRLQAREAVPAFQAPTQATDPNQRESHDRTFPNPQQRQNELLNALRNGSPAPVHASEQQDQRSREPSRVENHPPRLPYPYLHRPAPLPTPQSTGYASIIPAASELPPPKLTAHSAKLLNLFKSNKPTQAALEAVPPKPGAVSHPGFSSSFNKDLSNVADQASLEVSEIEDHHVDRNQHSARAPSEVSFEMPADNEPAVSLPDLTPPRPPLTRKQSPRETLAAWQQFQTTEASQEADQRQQAASENAAQIAEAARTGTVQQPEQPIIQETWKKVNVERDRDQRKVVDVIKSTEQATNHIAKQPKMALSNQLADQTKPNGISSNAAVASKPSNAPSTRSKHQNALLSLLKGPSATATPAKSTLQTPSPSFELSAVPSPGHSRETSRHTGPPTVQPVGNLSHILPMSQPTTKRGKATLAPRKSPVSATVDGPLNVPQFDVLRQNRKPSSESLQEKSKVEAPQKSPITILARPSKSQAAIRDGLPASLKADISSAPQIETPIPPAQKPALPQLKPVKPSVLPQKPHLSVASHFQSQTSLPPRPLPSDPQLQPQSTHHPKTTHIRPQAQDPNAIFSPIEPLPSPQHILAFDRRNQQTKEHKQSLLSLFNKPADPVSPTPSRSMAPLPPPSRVDSTASALISPPAVVGSFGERKESLSRRGTGEGTGSSSQPQTPRTSTPKDAKKFLLGYLDSVALGGK